MTMALVPALAFPSGALSRITQSGGDVTLDASGEYLARVMMAFEDMTISHVGMHIGFGGTTLVQKVRIETVDGSGNRTGTLWAANTELASFGPFGQDTWNVAALTSAAVIPRGSIFAVVHEWVSGTGDIVHGASGERSIKLPYDITNVTGAAVKTARGYQNIALGSSATDWYHVPGCIATRFGSEGNTHNSSSNPVRRGSKVTLPFKARLVGVRQQVSSSQVGDFNLEVYDAVGTSLLTSQAVEGDLPNFTGAAWNDYAFDDPITMDANVAYRITQQPTTASNIWFLIADMAAGTDAYKNANLWRGVGHYTRWQAGVWTDDTHKEFGHMLLLDQIDYSAGGGGGAPRSRIFGGF